jgi:hypothetical protein
VSLLLPDELVLLSALEVLLLKPRSSGRLGRLLLMAAALRLAKRLQEHRVGAVGRAVRSSFM